jgi:GNAT superfamily N-acetyltransferase
MWVYALPGNYLLPGISESNSEGLAFIEKQGYKEMRHVKAMVTSSLVGRSALSQADGALVIQGYTIRHASMDDATMVFGFVAKNCPNMADEVRRAFRASPSPGVLCLKNKTLVGFSVVEGNNCGLGTAGPMAVSKDHRKKGIANALVMHSIHLLSQRGFSQCRCLWISPVTAHILEATTEVLHASSFIICKKDLRTAVGVN